MGPHSIPDPEFFTNRRVRTIYETFSEGRARGLIHRDVDAYDGRMVTLDGQEFLNFSTCSYLGLEQDPRVIAGIHAEADRSGAEFSVSRVFASAAPYRRFEDQLTELFGAPVVVTASCTLGHFSVFSTMVQLRDAIVLDAQVHHSVMMAAPTAYGAQLHRVPHNDMDRLEALIQDLIADPNIDRIWYAGDGIYSMFGDVAPVDRLVELMDRYEPFYTYLDDAHGTSTQGKHGRGYVLGQMERIHPKMIVAASFTKSFGMSCGGALVVPHESWRDVIRTCGATMIFSGPVPPPMLGAGLASADIHLSDEMDTMMAELQSRIDAFQSYAGEANLRVPSDSRSPVQYVVIGPFERTLDVVETLFEAGLWVNICAYPAVPKDQCGIRVTMSRHVSEADIRRLVDGIVDATQQPAMARAA